MKTRYYIDCATCGGRETAKMSSRAPWVARYADQRIDIRVGPLARTMGACGTCGEVGRLISITMRARFGGPAPKCGGSCLNGKTSCDCRCNGRCHGAGACRCAA